MIQQRDSFVGCPVLPDATHSRDWIFRSSPSKTGKRTANDVVGRQIAETADY
jgi:hypothetical protein